MKSLASELNMYQAQVGPVGRGAGYRLCCCCCCCRCCHHRRWEWPGGGHGRRSGAAHATPRLPACFATAPSLGRPSAHSLLPPSPTPNHSPCQVQEYKYEVERLQREMNEVKRKYFEQKKLAAQQQQGAAGGGEGGAGELIPAARGGAASPSPLPGAASLKASPAVSAISLSVAAM